MLYTAILNIVVTLVFVYIGGGILITVFNEVWDNLNRSRAKHLEKAFTNLFYDQEWRDLAQKMKTSPYLNH